MQITDQQLQELRERNKQRLEEAKAKLGSKYLLHPANRTKRLPEPLKIGDIHIR